MINITFISLNDCSLFLYKLKKGEDIEDTIFNPVGLHFERNFEDGNVELTIINNKGRKVIETELKTNIIKLRTSKLSGKYFRQHKKNALVETI